MRILLIDCDTLRPDHLGCYGYARATSPNVDRIAAEAVRFTSCYVSDAPCLPSRTALFTGRMGVRTGVVAHAGTAARMQWPGDGHVTDPARWPLPMVLSHAGTHTASISTFGQRHLAWHFYAGWDEVHKFSNLGGNEIATDVEASALDWLRHNGHRDDWFLHVHYWDPHTPYRTPMEYGSPFEDAPAPPFPDETTLAEQWESYGPLSARDIGAMQRGTPRTPPHIRTRDDFKRWIDGYDTGIRFFDDSIGRLLDTLSGLGVLDDTAVVITSDHGENQGELNLYGAHLTADAITCRVPLILRWPGIAPAVRDDPLYLLDLGATLCELLGIDAPAAWDSRSFAVALRDEEYEARPYLVFGQGAWYVQRGILSQGHLYVRTLDPALDPMPDELLFDVVNDPHQQHQLIEARPDVADGLARQLADWWSDLAVEAGQDPLLTVVREGGGYYARVIRSAYLDRLRDTGRAWAAEEIETRRFAPVIDPFDMTRM